MNLQKILISTLSFISFSSAFKSIHIGHNFWGKSMKVSVPDNIDKSNCHLYVFHGGLFGKIPTDAYSSVLEPIIDNGNIVVHGNIGHMSAFMAQSGNLVVCGDAGDALGDSCYEARLFVRGSVKSLGADCEEKKMNKQHKIKLKGVSCQCPRQPFICLLYTSPSPRDKRQSRMPSSA